MLSQAVGAGEGRPTAGAPRFIRRNGITCNSAWLCGREKNRRARSLSSPAGAARSRVRRGGRGGVDDVDVVDDVDILRIGATCCAATDSQRRVIITIFPL